MKTFIVSLLFLVLLGIRDPASFAQLDQSYQKLAQEIEVLKSQLQTLENVEKIELTVKLADAQAKLADANAKLIDTEFGKFERELKNSYDGWLRIWTIVFLTVIGVFLAILFGISRAYWYWLSSKTEELIAAGIQERLNGFQEALVQADILKNEFQEAGNKIRVLNKEHAAEIVRRFMYYSLDNEDGYPEQIKELSEEALLDVLGDEIQDIDTRIRTLEILTRRGSTRSLSPALKFLNSTLDSHQDKELDLHTADHLRAFVSYLVWIPTQETYEGLTKFLNRLVREPIELKDLLLTATVPSIAWVSRELNKEDWLSLLKTSISHLDNEPETIKKILRRRLPDEMPSADDLEDYLLELLEKHDTDFVNNYRK